MFGYYGIGPVAPLNDSEVEPDPFTCMCAYKAPVGYLNPELSHCVWYQNKEVANQTAEPEPPDPPQCANDPIYAYDLAKYQTDLAAYKAARKHLRTALTMQSAGYKGSQHDRAVAVARVKRDQLAGD